MVKGYIPKKLLVEGQDDKRVIPELIEKNGIRFTAVFRYLDHTPTSVFLSSFAPSLRDAPRMRLLCETLRECVRYKNVVHLPENRCNLTVLS
ncbi:MAG: hypothetical protein HEQ19_29800 [Gloeotrichia echinulata CP02]